MLNINKENKNILERVNETILTVKIVKYKVEKTLSCNASNFLKIPFNFFITISLFLQEYFSRENNFAIFINHVKMSNSLQNL